MAGTRGCLISSLAAPRAGRQVSAVSLRRSGEREDPEPSLDGAELSIYALFAADALHLQRQAD